MENSDNPGERLKLLFEKYYKNESSKEEKEELAFLLANENNKVHLHQLLKQAWTNQEEEQLFSPAQSDAIYSSIIDAPKHEVRKNNFSLGRPYFRLYAVAAAIIGIMVLGYFFLFKKNTNKEVIVVTKPLQTDVAPGKEGAVLTLADGKQIVLDSAGNGLLASEENMEVTKRGGQISYGGQHGQRELYNTLTTPRGRQYSLILADGSKVWLNAASSIRFPTAFVSNERRVEITGEAYFEIAPDPSKPFHVITDDIRVAVLGTHFNVNAYGDESVIKTTLLEGKIRINNGSSTAILQPGEQAQIKGPNKVWVVKNVDVDDVIAWKNGLFSLKGTDVETLMKQIGRWYDIEVIYTDPLPQKRFVGSISRSVNLSDLLKALKEFGIRCRLENRKLIIEP